MHYLASHKENNGTYKPKTVVLLAIQTSVFLKIFTLTAVFTMFWYQRPNTAFVCGQTVDCIKKAVVLKSCLCGQGLRLQLNSNTQHKTCTNHANSNITHIGEAYSSCCCGVDAVPVWTLLMNSVLVRAWPFLGQPLFTGKCSALSEENRIMVIKAVYDRVGMMKQNISCLFHSHVM